MERNREQRLSEIELRLRRLLISACAGDEADYLIFLKEITSLLRGYFKKRLPAVYEDVEDLVQETLVAVHCHRHTYEASQPFTAWMYAIASYKLIDRWRAHGRQDSLTDLLDSDDEAFSSTDAEAKDARIDIHSLLARLPDRYRLPILQVKLNGFSIAEAAASSGMSESAVKVGIHRGLKLLAKLIKAEP